ncbi:hypothetical protein LUX12_09225 [Streptomyces somaliensis]|uniref:Uncharacterized protein n=1 Tax=Streptomyces somaliensis (strain ATCC 33201 / DSM 40738 / JCM 12659 / KCTC 9044 / NCTC 11332 / NRRL B-12077 / IP 733) TaxID=1134445 RepID=A0AA44DBZ9_STRE0|nr:hypothetical protein [Streptomyces somaliensis]MCP9944914.1 hypothetical protein [Streptomyces somaliensis]MCQ0024093.1 hypothetical protein [Streptomyces somaliensis DSM 40738]NKY14071.1 hypothetical protein [Streptomyces somaliensis DSM 40738]
MSQSVPPPPGNPFAAGPAAPQQPFPQAPAPARDNLVLGLLAALAAALVGAGAYGGIGGALEREVGYAAVGVGLLVGFTAGKVGGRSPVLGVASAALAAGAVYLGQLVTIAVLLGKMGEGSFTEVFFGNFGGVTDLWGLAADGMTYVFLAIGAVTAFAGARKGSA